MDAEHKMHALVPWVAVLAMLAGLMVLVGWTFDIGALKSFQPGWVSMKPNSAVCFILIGIALLPTSLPNPRLLCYSCGLLAGLIGALTLYEYAFGWNLGLDQQLFKEPFGTAGTSYPGRMSPETALCFVLLAIALLAGMRKSLVAAYVSVGSGMLVVALALAAMLSYATPNLGLYGWFGLPIMAIYTSFLFAMLGMAVIALFWQPEVFSLNARTTVAFACGITLLTFIGFNASRFQTLIIEANLQIEHIENVQNDVVSILEEVTDAQNHTRGYVITRDEIFLTSYLLSKAKCNRKLADLKQRELVVDDPVHQHHFEKVAALVTAQLAWHQQVIDAARSGKTDIRNMVRHGEGLLENLRTEFAQIQSEHSQESLRMKQKLEKVSSLSFIIIFLGTLTSLLIFLTLAFLLNLDEIKRQVYEAKILRLSQLYNALNQCSQAITRSASEEELYGSICNIAVQVGGLKLAWVGLVDETKQQVAPVASCGAGVAYLEGIQILLDADSPFGCGPTGACIRENRPFWCQDFMHDPLTAPWHERGARFGWRASAALPLHKKGAVTGALSFYSDREGIFDEETRKLLLEMAGNISYALDHFALEAEHKKIEEEMNNIHWLLNKAELLGKFGGWEFNIDTKKQKWTDGVYHIHEVDLSYEQSVEKGINFYTPASRPIIGQAVQRAIEHGEPYDLELKIITAKGNIKNVHTIGNADFKNRRVYGIFQDITERKKAEQALEALLAEKEVLMREVHHRVKNNMQMMSALLELQSGYVKDEQALGYFRDSQQRIQSMAMIHEQLYRNNNIAQIDFAAYLKSLVESLRGQYGEQCSKVDIWIDAKDCTLPVDTAISCGLVVNELVSNVFKHAFPNCGQGELRIKVKLGSDRKLVLEVIDDGIGLPAGFDIHQSRTFGLRMVARMVEGQLDGKLMIESLSPTSPPVGESDVASLRENLFNHGTRVLCEMVL